MRLSGGNVKIIHIAKGYIKPLWQGLHWYFVRNPQVQTSNSYSVNSTLNSDNPKERKSLNTEYTKAPPRVQT